jgi:Spy/CpxP family protein refolding chaperone
MTPFPYRHLLAAAALVLTVASADALGSQAQPFPWWKAVRDLGLSPEQSTMIDGIFQSTMPELRQEAQELNRLEAKLSKLIEADADELQVLRQVDRVEAARAAINKMRTMMLFRMRQVMTTEQRARFKAMQERWEARAGGPARGGDESRRRDGSDTPGTPGRSGSAPSPGTPGTNDGRD